MSHLNFHQLRIDQLSCDELKTDKLKVDQLSMNGVDIKQLSIDQLNFDQLSIKGLKINGLNIRGLAINGPNLNESSIDELDSSATSASKETELTTGTTYFRLLNLPAELRLMIYDHLLSPVVAKPEHLDTFMLPDEFPDTSLLLQPYFNFIQTSKRIRNEVKTHFEKHYFPHLTFYFEDAYHFINFCRKATQLGPDFHNLKVLLHNGSFQCWPYRRPIYALSEEAREYICKYCRPNAAKVLRDLLNSNHQFPARRRFIIGNVIGFNIKRNGQPPIQKFFLPADAGAEGSGISAHRIHAPERGLEAAMYYQLTATVSLVSRGEMEKYKSTFDACLELERGPEGKMVEAGWEDLGAGNNMSAENTRRRYAVTRAQVKQMRTRLCRKIMRLEGETWDG